MITDSMITRKLTVNVPSVDDIDEVLDSVSGQTDVWFGGNRHIAVKTPVQCIGKVSDSVILKINVHIQVLGAYERPRLQFRDAVAWDSDVWQWG